MDGVGEFVDVVSAGGQVGAPFGMVLQLGWGGGKPGQRASASAPFVVSDAPGEDGRGVVAGGDRFGAGASESCDGVASVRLNYEEFGLQCLPSGGFGEAGQCGFDPAFECADAEVAGYVGGGERDRVGVPVDRVLQLGTGVVGFA